MALLRNGRSLMQGWVDGHADRGRAGPIEQAPPGY
jgi:hypothetical protein